MPKEDVMTTLDEIQARNDETKAKARWAGTKPSPAHEDRNKLIAALRAVEAVHEPWDSEEFYNGMDGESRSTIKYYCGTCVDGDEVPYSWPCPTIRAIREALGS